MRLFYGPNDAEAALIVWVIFYMSAECFWLHVPLSNIYRNECGPALSRSLYTSMLLPLSFQNGQLAVDDDTFTFPVHTGHIVFFSFRNLPFLKNLFLFLMAVFPIIFMSCVFFLSMSLIMLVGSMFSLVKAKA